MLRVATRTFAARLRTVDLGQSLDSFVVAGDWCLAGVDCRGAASGRRLAEVPDDFACVDVLMVLAGAGPGRGLGCGGARG